MRDRVARAYVGDGLHAGNDVADVAGRELVPLLALQAKSPNFLDPIRGFVVMEADDVARPDRSGK